MADIFEEIDEELKQDRFYQWWKQYGKFVVAVLTILILATGAFFWWDSYQKKQLEAQSASLSSAVAMVTAGKNEEAGKVFDDLIAEGGTYGMLAGFERAKLHLTMGDKAGAIGVLEAISADTGLDDQYRDRAKLFALMQQIGDKDAAELINGFEALAAPTGTYRFTALEMIGVVKAQSGDVEGAKEGLNELVKIEDVPPSLVTRVEEFLKTLD
ncbi:MAG: tetratricopeptide repeat protein [Alphaproteobacteria bacterium]